jgi:hypothetical protein
LIIKIELEMVPRLVGPPQQTTTEPGINEIADNFLPLVPSQISTMTLGGSSSLGWYAATDATKQIQF